MNFLWKLGLICNNIFWSMIRFFHCGFFWRKLKFISIIILGFIGLSGSSHPFGWVLFSHLRKRSSFLVFFHLWSPKYIIIIVWLIIRFIFMIFLGVWQVMEGCLSSLDQGCEFFVEIILLMMMTKLIKIFRIYDKVIVLVVEGYLLAFPILKNVT